MSYADVQTGGLRVARVLHDFIKDEALPGTGVAAARFWPALEAIMADLAPRNRALLATYTSEKDIEAARKRALADNQRAVKEAQERIEALKKRRAGYDKEMAFYKEADKAPPKLQDDIRATEVDLEATQGLLEAKQKETAHINAKYDEDRRRYRELTGKK